MALSGSFAVGTNGNITGQLDWNVTNQDIAGNYSDVSVTLKFRRTTAYRTYGSSGSWTVWIHGQPVTASHSYDYPASMAWVTVLTGSARVYHEADGSKSMRLEVDGNTDTHDVNYTDTWHTLNTIPRASTFNGGIDFTAAVDNFWMSIDRKDSSFHHTVQMYVQHTYDGNWDYVGQRTWVGDSGWWNFTEDENKQLYTTINGYEERPLLIRVYTYNSGHTAQIGDYKDTIGKVRAYATGVAAFNDFNIGTVSVPATIQNYHSAFEYNVTLKFGAMTIPYGKVGQNFNLTFDNARITEMYNQIPNAASGTGEVIVRTTYKDIYIEDGAPATNKKNFTAYVVNSEPTFDTIGYYDSNSAMVAITGDNKSIIQNKSFVTAQVANAWKAQPKNGASITKYVATLNGATLTVNAPFPTDINFDFGVVNSALHLNLEITAYDSRGFTKKVPTQVTMIPYAPPVVQTQALRESGFGSAVTLTLSGSIAPLNVKGTNKNSLVPAGVNYKWRQLPAGAWSANIQFLGQTLTMPNFTTTAVPLTMDTTLAFEIVVQVTDQIGNTTVTLQVAVGTPILFIDEVKKSVGIGQFPNGWGTLELFGGDINPNGGRSIPNNNLDTCFKTGTYLYNPDTVGKPFGTATSGYGVVEVIVSNGSEYNGSSNWIWQIAYSTDTVAKTMFRNKVNAGAWSPWLKFGAITNTDGACYQLPTGSNLNSNFDTGLYMGDETVTNRPPVSAWFYMLVFKHNDNFCSQTCWDLWTNKTYERRKINTVWNPWRLVGGYEGGTISAVTPWSHYDGVGGYQTPQWWKVNGMVFLQGLFRGNGAGVGSWLGVLPSGCRPGAQALYHVNSEGGMCRVDIQSDGVIIWSGGGGSGWMSLEGISFMAEN